jgi:hypothetical protein
MSIKRFAAAVAAGLILTAALVANQTDKEGDDKLVIKANHIKKIEFSGTHYFGYTSVTPGKETSTSAAAAGFESRRNYVQMKSYFNDHDYFRVTLDAAKGLESGTTGTGNSKGYTVTYIKYAYLWLNDVLPFTGAEVGISHRPWIDYEEHNGWLWRSINKVVIEEKTPKSAGDLINSADFGFNLKTKLPDFSSEIGFFNGEGYHADKAAAMQDNSTDLSFEGRLTYHVLGNGDKKLKPKKDTYLNISTAWLMSANHKDNNISVGDADEYDRLFNTLHVVYNRPEFLIAAQYIASKDTHKDSADDVTQNIISVNGDLRLGAYTLLARYDSISYNKDGDEDKTKSGTTIIAGVAYDYIPGVKFIGNIKNYANKDSADNNVNAFMLTTEVHW